METHTSHLKAAQLREEGEFMEALQLYQVALLEYAHTENAEGMVRVLLERVIIFHHLFDSEEVSYYLDLASADLDLAEFLVDKGNLSEEILSLLQLAFGNYAMRLQDYVEALDAYQEALQCATDDATRANVQVHLADTLWYLERYAESDQLLSEALSIIENETGEIADTTRRTWLSGALLKKAAHLLESDPHQAREWLAKAQTVIDASPTLVVRKQQLKKLQSLLA
jgi:tetratricopeptide (TPR) repeat protein